MSVMLEVKVYHIKRFSGGFNDEGDLWEVVAALAGGGGGSGGGRRWWWQRWW